MPPKSRTSTKQQPKDDGPPYDYMKALQTYISCRNNAYPSTAPQLPTISMTSSSDHIDPVDKSLLRSGLEALGQMSQCKADVEGGGVLPPLVSVLAAVDQQTVSPPQTPDDSFAQSTLKTYPGSLFVHLEGALALPLPRPEDKVRSKRSSECAKSVLTTSQSSIAASLQYISAAGSSSSQCPAVDRLSCLARAYVATFRGMDLNMSSPLPPLWLAYADSTSDSSESLSASWEGLTAVQCVNRSLRLALQETHESLQDDLLKAKVAEVYAHVASSMLPVSDYDAYHFGTYFSSVKSRVHGLKRELEDEAFSGDGAAAIIEAADKILSTSPPLIDDLTVQFHKSVHSTCESLQSKLADIGMSAYYSEADVPPLDSGEGLGQNLLHHQHLFHHRDTILTRHASRTLALCSAGRRIPERLRQPNPPGGSFLGGQ